VVAVGCDIHFFVEKTLRILFWFDSCRRRWYEHCFADRATRG